MDRSKAGWGGATRRWGIILSGVAALAWCSACVAALAYYTPRAHSAVRELLLIYFQPMLPITAALWLWGHTVQRFSALSIEYEICFTVKDRKYLLPYGDIYRIALVLTTACLTCAAAFVYLGASGSYSAADYAPRAMYLAAALLLVAPVELLCRPARLFFGGTLRRALLPFQEVSWADFLLADVMTSLSKSCGDLAKAAAALVAGPALHTHMLALGSGGLLSAAAPAAHVVDPLALPVLAALCLPFAVRFVQCLVVHRTTGNRSQLFNAAKYATAFPSLVLTAIEHEYHVAGLRYPLYGWWLAAILLNSLYSFYWDLEMDWDMPWLVQPGATSVLGLVRLPGLKPDPLYRRGWYAWAAASNLALRLCWAHRLVGRLEARNSVLLAVALLEVARRYQWTFIRVETEIRKIRVKQAHEHAEPGEAGQEDP